MTNLVHHPTEHRHTHAVRHNGRHIAFASRTLAGPWVTDLIPGQRWKTMSACLDAIHAHDHATTSPPFDRTHAGGPEPYQPETTP